MKMPKMQSLAMNYDKMEVSPESNQPHYPSLYLEGKQIPECLKEMEVGSECVFMVKARIAGKRESINGRNTLDLELTGIAEMESEEGEE